jgi:hypothetical protein
MAIHPDVPGLVVSIDVGGQDLPEYDEEDADWLKPNTTTKYVETASGEPFGVLFALVPPPFCSRTERSPSRSTSTANAPLSGGSGPSTSPGRIFKSRQVGLVEQVMATVSRAPSYSAN